jgi:hypothetical protein
LVPTQEAPVRRIGTLGLIAYHDVRTIESVSPTRLRLVLHQITAALAAGRDPMAEPWLAPIGYDPGRPLAQRLARLSLLNLSDPVKAQLVADPLFNALLASPAGLLVVGRNLINYIRGQLADGGAVLNQTDQSGLGPLRQSRTIGQLVRSRIEWAAAEFDAIAADVRALLDAPAPDPREARIELRRLTLRWSEAMQKLAAVASLNLTDDGRPDIPVLTRRLLPDAWKVNAVLSAPMALDRTGAAPRASTSTTNWSRSTQLSSRVRPPNRPLAPTLNDASHLGCDSPSVLLESSLRSPAVGHQRPVASRLRFLAWRKLPQSTQRRWPPGWSARVPPPRPRAWTYCWCLRGRTCGT